MKAQVVVPTPVPPPPKTVIIEMSVEDASALLRAVGKNETGTIKDDLWAGRAVDRKRESLGARLFDALGSAFRDERTSQQAQERERGGE